jgi:hypothetical protein
LISPSASASSVIDCFILKWALSLLWNDVRHAPWYFSSCATTSPALYFAKSFWSCKFCAHWWSLVVVEAQCGSTGCVVFKLADLCNIYESRLKQFETNNIYIIRHSTEHVWKINCC